MTRSSPRCFTRKSELKAPSVSCMSFRFRLSTRKYLDRPQWGIRKPRLHSSRTIVLTSFRRELLSRARTPKTHAVRRGRTREFGISAMSSFPTSLAFANQDKRGPEIGVAPGNVLSSQQGEFRLLQGGALR